MNKRRIIKENVLEIFLLHRIFYSIYLMKNALKIINLILYYTNFILVFLQFIHLY